MPSQALAAISGFKPPAQNTSLVPLATVRYNTRSLLVCSLAYMRRSTSRGVTVQRTTQRDQQAAGVLRSAIPFAYRIYLLVGGFTRGRKHHYPAPRRGTS